MKVADVRTVPYDVGHGLLNGLRLLLGLHAEDFLRAGVGDGDFVALRHTGVGAGGPLRL